MSNEELISEIQKNFTEIETADRRRIPVVLNTIIRQISRLTITDRKTEIQIAKVMLSFRDMLSSEKQLAEMSKSSPDSIAAYGESFLKSLMILKDELYNLFQNIK